LLVKTLRENLSLNHPQFSGSLSITDQVITTQKSRYRKDTNHISGFKIFKNGRKSFKIFKSFRKKIFSIQKIPPNPFANIKKYFFRNLSLLNQKMYYNYYYSSLTLLITLLIQRAKATTEWFGDARAHMNPPQQPPFYDIVYDESGI